MYFPYLRGRQFELVALRELLEKELISEKIIPIIEPVKNTPSLQKTLDSYQNKKKNILFVRNPKVGSFDIKEGDNLLKKNEYVINTYFLNSKTKKEVPGNANVAIILKSPDDLDLYSEIYKNNDNKYTLIEPLKELEREIENNRILFKNHFNSKEKNADFANEPDEFFSNDHLYYLKEGYIGFSDYSVIGDKYTEGGFAPFAVVIHIVYFDEKKRLRIQHFISDSNSDSSNTPGKLKEALDKLIKWNKNYNYTTYGMQQFEELQKTGKYPGLGTIKKLSIMHHIELMNNYLKEEENRDNL